MSADPWRILLAALPMIVLLVGLLRLGWTGARAGTIALATAAGVALTAFATPVGVLGVAAWRAVALAGHVLLIVWAALLLYQFADATGAIRSIGHAVAHLTEDHILQLLILGFAFSSFLQGVAGFGVPVAVTAPLLIGLGFAPLEAAAVPLVGHAWAVTMGDMASSFQALRAVTGLPARDLGISIAVLLGLAAIASGFAIAHIHAGTRPYRRAFGAILALGLAMGGTQLVLALTQHWIVASFGAGMVGLVVSVALARLIRRRGPGLYSLLPHWPPPRGRREPPRPAPVAAPEMPFHVAFLPYYILIVIVGIATFTPLRQVLERVAIAVTFPATVTGRGWQTAAADFALPVLAHPGALLLYTTAVAVVCFRALRRPVPRWGGVWRAVRAQGIPTTLTIVSLVGVAMIMLYSGMTAALARGLTRLVGPLFPLISPFLGMLGTFITGSNTNSNVLFAPLQQEGARLLQMDPVLMAALQSAGGALGSMVAPAKIVLATVTTGLVGQEGRVMRITVKYALAMTAGLAVLGWIVQIWGRR